MNKKKMSNSFWIFNRLSNLNDFLSDNFSHFKPTKPVLHIFLNKGCPIYEILY